MVARRWWDGRYWGVHSGILLPLASTALCAVGAARRARRCLLGGGVRFLQTRVQNRAHGHVRASNSQATVIPPLLAVHTACAHCVAFCYLHPPCHAGRVRRASAMHAFDVDSAVGASIRA